MHTPLPERPSPGLSMSREAARRQLGPATGWHLPSAVRLLPPHPWVTAQPGHRWAGMASSACPHPGSPPGPRPAGSLLELLGLCLADPTLPQQRTAPGLREGQVGTGDCKGLRPRTQPEQRPKAGRQAGRVSCCPAYSEAAASLCTRTSPGPPAPLQPGPAPARPPRCCFVLGEGVFLSSRRPGQLPRPP